MEKISQHLHESVASGLSTEPGLHLSGREKLILRSIIHNYILNADPVGSRALARRYHLDLSPATIRNTMSDLEEMGLLAHPHTSAGRVPTDLGYRLYVDDLMQVDVLSEEERYSIQAQLDAVTQVASDVMERVSELLGEVSRLLAFILEPDIAGGVLEKVELVRVGEGRIMTVIVVNSGMVRTIMLEINSPISNAEIHAATSVINQRLTGMKLADIPRNIGSRLSGDSRAANAIVRLFLDFPERIFTPEYRSEMHIGGARRVIEQPEFGKPEKVKGIIELIEESDVIVHLVKDRVQGVTVTIGQENETEQFRDFSVITSTYRVGDEVGTLGIIGPTRMNYSKLVSLVDYTSRLVTERVARKG
jgi:heat-inducible transcriptional repressor